MLQLFDSAVVAARAQAILILLTTAILLASGVIGDGHAAAGSREYALTDPALLKWIFLAAAGIAAVAFKQSLSRTASRVARETHHMTGGRGKRLRMGLLMNLRLATAAMGLLTITPAPRLLVRLLGSLLDADVTAFAWAGGMSVGVAYFGAAASAARRALRGDTAVRK
jgi:hypothetical protein